MMELPKDVGSDMLDMKLNERTPATSADVLGSLHSKGKSTWKQQTLKYKVIFHRTMINYGRKGVHSRKLKAGMPNIGGLVQMIFP